MKPILEEINLSGNESILAFEYANENFETPWHFHPQHELTYISGSTGTKFIGDHVGNYEPGELVLLRSFLPHCWKNYRNPEVYARSTVIQWNPGIFAPVPELSGLNDMMEDAALGIIFDKTQIAQMIPRILDLTTKGPSDLYVSLLSILISLTKCKYDPLSTILFKNDISDEFSSRISKVQDFVRTEFHRKIYLAEPASLIDLTEPSFARFFGNAMGRPFFTYLNQYRVNQVCKSLVDTDWPVSQIAYSCGFESMPHMNRQFKLIKGETPSQFRKKHRKY